MSDKKIIRQGESSIIYRDADTSDGTKPVRLWDLLRTLSLNYAYINVWEYDDGTRIFFGNYLNEEEWKAFLEDEATKRMQVKDVKAFAENYGSDVYLSISVIKDEEEES